MAPTGAQRTDRDPEQDYRAAMQSLIADRWALVWNAVPAALSGDDPEGVHDVRVASRRLRAAMDVAADAFPKRWYRSLHQSAKAITRALGEVRDREVMLEALSKERTRAKVAERAGLDRLIARVEREHDAARLEMVTFLAELEANGVQKESHRRFPLPAEAPKANKSSKKGTRS